MHLFLLCLLLLVDGLLAAWWWSSSTSLYWNGYGSIEYKLDKGTSSQANLVKKVDQFFALSRQAWPGYRANSTPFFLLFDDDRLYGFNLAQSSPSWRKGEGSYLVSSSPLPEWIALHPGFHTIEGGRAAIYRVDGGNFKQRDLFHDIVYAHFSQFASKQFVPLYPNAYLYLDHLDAENLTLIQLEEMLLSDFLHAMLDDAKSKQHKMQHLYDYIVVAERRSIGLQTLSRNWEQELQRKEGMAYYVALKTEQSLLKEPMAPIMTLMAELESPAMNEEILHRSIYGRQRLVGAAIALALDLLKVDSWKKQIIEGACPLQLLAQQFPMGEEERELRYEKIESRYGHEGVKKQVSSLLEEYQRDIRELSYQFDSEQGITLELVAPSSSTSLSEGNSLYLYYLEEGERLFLFNTSHYCSPGEPWELAFSSQPMMIQPDPQRYLFKLTEDTLFQFDEQQLTLTDLLSQLRRTGSFTSSASLLISTPHWHLTSRQRPVRIALVGEQLLLDFSSPQDQN